jgi:sarcosine oxidase subunit gamma
MAEVQVRRIQGRTILRLRGRHTEGAGRERAAALAGQRLPSRVGETQADSTRVLCLGPRDWLLVSNQYAPCTLRRSLEPDWASEGLVLVDMSEGLAVLEVQGTASRELLAKGCGLDLHPRRFPVGHCARTRFAQIAGVIDCLGEPSRFELFVVRSYADYLHAWLRDAAVEFDGPRA